jgi:hypothetical protein
MKRVLALIISITAVPAVAAAQERSPVGGPIQGYLGQALQGYQGQGLRTDYQGHSARLSRHTGAETEKTGNDPVYLRGLEREMQLQQRGAVYGVAYLPLTPKADFFARVGYGGGGSKAAPVGFGGQDAWKYGAGAQYFPNARDGLRADFTRQDFRNSRVKANVVSMGYVRRF